MPVARQTDATNPPARALTIGTFDGVHRGHAALVRAARTAVGPEGRVVVLVLDPHPQSVLRPGTEPARLSTAAQRRSRLLEVGADEVEVIPPTAELLGQSPEAFIKGLFARRPFHVIVEGPDFRFGAARAGDNQLLAALGRAMGFDSLVVPPVEAVLEDHSIVPARSTVARWLIRHGRVADAAVLLDRPYEVDGVVVRGDRRGRTIGYPTANIDTPCLLPADGVYGGWATLEDGRRLRAAISVGTKPTFDGAERALEAYFMLPGERETGWRPLAGLAEYGWRVRLSFVAFIRDQVKFAGLEPLLQQMDRDCERIGAVLDVGGSAALA